MSQDRQPAAIKKDLILEEGVTYEAKEIWADGLGPIDFTGYNGAFQVRDEYTGELLLDLTVANNGLILGTTDGQYTVRIQHPALSNLNWEHAVYSLRVIGPVTGDYPDGRAIKLEYGNITIVQSVVR